MMLGGKQPERRDSDDIVDLLGQLQRSVDQAKAVMSKHIHRPRRSGVGIRQTFGPHPWRDRLRAAMDGKPTTKAMEKVREGRT